ncbi:lipoyl(octanoyl) transferase LipB [Solicola gregarius]|uniref:Octanoyltransferase n=1 Tax=Solicola gregarius TaxID=2908642 RepID=A0AA46TMB1_9ACTN|nr:lipoyl(octanoyl) transferase LipB [Solicola gregarius]UYM07944.1 lipoyl(octanoyl) transferase LipB [Solicola gregarius]
MSAEPQQSRTRAGLQIRYGGFGDNAVDYASAWETQRRLHEQRVADEIGDVALFVEHPPVYTAGKRTNPLDRPTDGTPVVEVDRGGSVTFHGPGQLVGYPIAKLPSHVYVVDYVRRVEEALIRAVGDLGIACGRVKGRSGVWIPADGRGDERKVAAIGVRVAGKVTMHGFALNCDVDLAWYDRFVPCGIRDAGVTSLTQELGRRVSVDEAARLVEPHLHDLLSWRPYDRSPVIAATAEPSQGVTYGIDPLR